LQVTQKETNNTTERGKDKKEPRIEVKTTPCGKVSKKIIKEGKREIQKKTHLSSCSLKKERKNTNTKKSSSGKKTKSQHSQTRFDRQKPQPGTKTKKNTATYTIMAVSSKQRLRSKKFGVHLTNVGQRRARLTKR